MIEQEEMTTTFRREVLSRCQKEFEKDRRNNDETEAMQEAIETAETVGYILSHDYCVTLFFLTFSLS